MKNFLKQSLIVLASIFLISTTAYAVTTFNVGQGGTGVNTITGIIKGNGTAHFTPATAGVDYVIPSALSGYIPYTGGTSNVDLGLHNLTVDTNTLFVDSVNHMVGIGTTVPESKLTVSLAGQAVSTAFLSGTMPLSLLSGSGQNIISGIAMSSNAPAERGTLQLRKSRGTVVAPTAVVNGDTLASFSSGGYSGSSTIFSSQIDFIVDGTVTSTTVPQRISFLTGTTAANRTERMVIKSDGNVGIGTTNPGVKLDVRLANNNAGNAISFGSNSDSMGKLGEDSSVNGVWLANSYVTNSANYIDFRLANNTTGKNNTTNANTSMMRILNNGNVGIGTTTPTAVLHLKAGTATANTAPLKFTSGVDLTTPETGAMEYDGTNLHFTPTGTLRENIHTGGRGSITLTAGTTTTITDTTAKTTSTIMITATSLGATTLQPYVSTKNNGSFVITTLIAGGTETIDYLVIN